MTIIALPLTMACLRIKRPLVMSAGLKVRTMVGLFTLLLGACSPGHDQGTSTHQSKAAADLPTRGDTFAAYAFGSDTFLKQDDIFRGGQLLGQRWVLHYWATWCPPCRKEWPDLMLLAKQGVTIVGVNTMDDRNAVNHWLQSSGNPFRFHLSFQNSLGKSLAPQPQGLPATLLIGTDGHVMWQTRGPLGAQGLANIQRLLKQVH